jgi:hypothetical protein
MIRFIAVAMVAVCLGPTTQAQTPLADKVQALANQAQQSSGFRKAGLELDLYRVLAAAGAPLPDELRIHAGEIALNWGLGVEAEAALAPLVASGLYGGSSDRFRARNMSAFEAAKRDAASDRTGGIAADETDAVIEDTGRRYIVVGEACIGAEKYADAIRLIDRGLTRGGLTRSEIARANLLRGIAYYRSGDEDRARTAWSSVDADNGAREIAKAWLAILQTG